MATSTRFFCFRAETGLIIWGTLAAMFYTISFVSCLLIYMDISEDNFSETYNIHGAIIPVGYWKVVVVTMSISLVGIVTSGLLVIGIMNVFRLAEIYVCEIYEF